MTVDGRAAKRARREAPHRALAEVQAQCDAAHVQDPRIMHLDKQIIKVGSRKVGVPQGGPFSPRAANIYLNELDWFFDAIRRKTAEGAYEASEPSSVRR